MSDPRNNVSLAVGIVADPEVKTLSSGSKVVELRLALNYAMRDSDNPENKTAWLNGKMFDNGDRMSKFVIDQIDAGNIKKGSQVLINGKLEFNQYTNKDQVKVLVPEINISGLAYQYAGEKKDASESGSKPAAAPASPIGDF